MRKIVFCLLSLMLTVGMVNCSEKDGAPKPGTEKPDPKPDPDPDPKPDPDPEPVGDYPRGVTVEEFTEDLGGGKQCLGFVATIDFEANPKLRFTASHNVPLKTPTVIYKELDAARGAACLVINGGYVSGVTSVSLAVSDGRVLCNNFPAINWPNDENAKYTVYPVRSAFGLMDDGRFESQWAYCVNASSKNHFAFPSAMGNDERTQTFMAAPPSATTEGAYLWKPREAIGGGPRLVEKGANVAVTNYWKEVLDSGGTGGLSRQPRTAIGVTADNRLVLLVCDGRDMRSSAGYTLSEMADKLIAIGVVSAINLDGGGSSCIVGKDGQVLNRPSGSGTGAIVERKVSTAVIISEMNE